MSGRAAAIRLDLVQSVFSCDLFVHYFRLEFEKPILVFDILQSPPQDQGLLQPSNEQSCEEILLFSDTLPPHQPL